MFIIRISSVRVGKILFQRKSAILRAVPSSAKISSDFDSTSPSAPASSINTFGLIKTAVESAALLVDSSEDLVASFSGAVTAALTDSSSEVALFSSCCCCLSSLSFAASRTLSINAFL